MPNIHDPDRTSCWQAGKLVVYSTGATRTWPVPPYTESDRVVVIVTDRAIARATLSSGIKFRSRKS